jgi:hypothetical protein
VLTLKLWCRLVSELSLVEKNLDFWVERLRQGKHLRTMLFGQGPVSFAKDLKQIIRKQERRDTASERIERRVSIQKVTIQNSESSESKRYSVKHSAKVQSMV